MRYPLQYFGTFVAFIITLTLTGCGEKEPIPPGTPSVFPSNTGTPVVDLSIPPRDAPEDAAITVSKFLEAMLRGDSSAIRSLLTPLARTKGEENGVPFAPVSSPTADFTIDKTVAKGEIGAYVHTTLNDVDERGRKESAEIVWIVARCDEGWRIAGAAVMLFEGQEKTVLNFEDLEAALLAIADAEKREIKRRKEASNIKQVGFTPGLHR